MDTLLFMAPKPKHWLALTFRLAANTFGGLLFIVVLLLVPATRNIFTSPGNWAALGLTLLAANLLQEINRSINSAVLHKFPNDELRRNLLEWASVPLVTSGFLLLLGYLLPPVPYSEGCTAFAIGLPLFCALHAGRSLQRATLFGCRLADHEKRQKELAVAQLNLMRSHFNPHFMFNCMNALSSLIHLDHEGASKFVDELSTVIRYVMANKDAPLVALQGEMEFFKSYTYLAKVRMRDKVHFNINIPANLMQRRLPPLVFHHIAEAAFRDNEVSSEHPMTINIFADNGEIVVHHSLQRRNPDDLPGHEIAERINLRFQILNTPLPRFQITDTEFTAHFTLLSEPV